MCGKFVHVDSLRIYVVSFQYIQFDTLRKVIPYTSEEQVVYCTFQNTSCMGTYYIDYIEYVYTYMPNINV